MYLLCEFQSKFLKIYDMLSVEFSRIHLTHLLFLNIYVVCTLNFACLSIYFLRISNGIRMGHKGVSIFNESSRKNEPRYIPTGWV